MLSNSYNLKREAAIGSGEYLNAFSVMLGFDSRQVVLDSMKLNPDNYWFAVSFLKYIE